MLEVVATLPLKIGMSSTKLRECFPMESEEKFK